MAKFSEVFSTTFKVAISIILVLAAVLVVSTVTFHWDAFMAGMSPSLDAIHNAYHPDEAAAAQDAAIAVAFCQRETEKLQPRATTHLLSYSRKVVAENAGEFGPIRTWDVHLSYKASAPRLPPMTSECSASVGPGGQPRLIGTIQIVGGAKPAKAK